MYMPSDICVLRASGKARLLSFAIVLFGVHDDVVAQVQDNLTVIY